MSRCFAVATGQQQQLVRRSIQSSDEYLAAIDNKVLSLFLVAQSVGLLVSLIRAGFRFSEELPGSYLTQEDGW